MRFDFQVRTRHEMRTANGLRSFAVCWAAIALLSLIFCEAGIAAQAGSGPAAIAGRRVLTDELGRKVPLPREVHRVVSLAPNLTEIVFALGFGTQLAGDTNFCDYPAEALSKPHVGGPVNPNLEEIASLMPDLVLATKSINRRETVTALERIGVPVYVTDPHSVDEMIASVEHVGRALGTEKPATALADDLRRRLSDLDQRVARSSPRSVLFVVWTDPLISVGRDTFIADALRRAGGRSIVETAAEWPHISLEEIVRLQPEVLVFASAHAGDTQRDIETLRVRPGWKDLRAIERGDVVVISDAINRPAPRMVDVIGELARALHPDAFASLAEPAAHSSLMASDSRSVLDPPSKPKSEEACACAR